MSDVAIGQRPNDRRRCVFHPINPGHEEASWDRFLNEGIGKFFAGEYAGEYEAKLIAEFDGYLPAEPPWGR